MHRCFLCSSDTALFQEHFTSQQRLPKLSPPSNSGLRHYPSPTTNTGAQAISCALARQQPPATPPFPLQQPSTALTASPSSKLPQPATLCPHRQPRNRTDLHPTFLSIRPPLSRRCRGAWSHGRPCQHVGRQRRREQSKIPAVPPRPQQPSTAEYSQAQPSTAEHSPHS